MEYVVDGSAEDVLDRTEAYFERGWPYPGFINRSRTAVAYSENPGCLSPITTANVKRVRVVATDEADGGALVSVSAQRAKHADTLDRWIREDLGGRPR